MPVYDYVCKTCGETTELNKLPAEGAVMRHVLPATKQGDGDYKVCGTFRRVWSTVNVNTTNLRAARG